MSSSVTTERGTDPGTVLAQPPLPRWRTVDLITAALIAVTMGVMFWVWSLAYSTTLSVPFSAGLAPFVSLLGGPWLLAGVLGGLIVRRPGAALFAEVLAAAVSATLGNEWGWTTLISGVLQGLGAELIFALFLYRRFSVLVAVLAGAMAAVFEMGYEWFYYWADWSVEWKLIYLGCFMASGALVAGVGGVLLTRALARAGALPAMPPGEEAHQRGAA